MPAPKTKKGQALDALKGEIRPILSQQIAIFESRETITDERWESLEVDLNLMVSRCQALIRRIPSLKR